MSILTKLKSDLSGNLKNIRGWSTNRKIVVFAVDDYGNVRIDSETALRQMEADGMKAFSNFDRFDALETESDLSQLFEVLSSVKDKNGSSAAFTAFSLPANIDYETMAANDYQKYEYELLPQTFAKLKGYERTWDVWQQGISEKLIEPQFHGREHLNINILEKALQNKDHNTLVALKNRSYTRITTKTYPSYTAAFDFVNFSENEAFKEIIIDGLNCFEKVFGFRATNFNSPGGREHSVLHKTLHENGIRFMDMPFDKKEYQGDGKYIRQINYMGKKNNLGQTYLIRNAVFEPVDKRKSNHIGNTLKQIELAFRWNKPAVISSHRVNFCGHIDENNRKNGLDALGKLLQEIVKKWPDAEFMTSSELGKLIASEKK